MSADPAKLWQPEANRALLEWSKQFEAKKVELIRAATGNIHDPNTAIAIGAEAKHLFDVVGDQVLQNVRDLLTHSDNLDEIGTPEQATQILIDPLERKAHQVIANLRHQIKAQNQASAGLPDKHLARTKEELQAAATTLRPQLQTVVRLRRQQIEQAAQSAAAQSKNDWWQRLANQVTVINFAILFAGFVLGYAAGLVNLLAPMLRFFGLSGDVPSTNY